MATLALNGAPDDIQEMKLQDVPSAIPLAVKNRILDCTRTAVSIVKNAVGSCLIAGTLAVGGAPAPAMAVEQQNTVPLLQSKGFSPESIKNVVALSNFVREKQANGELAPTEAVSIINVTPLTPDGKGLDQLVNTGSLLPKKTFTEVTGQASLTTENYNTVVETLFDPTDIDLWLTRSDGTPMSAQEKADYRESLASAKVRWLAKLPEFVKTGKQEVITRWFELFNTLATKPIHGSRVEYQRGFIAANAMANYSTISPDKKALFAPATVTQAAEYILIKDPTAELIKIERLFNEPGKKPFTLKYLVASDKSMEKVGFAEGVQATQIAIRGWNQDQTKKYALKSEATALKSEATALKSEATALKSETDKMKRLNDLSFLILADFAQLEKERTNPQFISSLNKNLKALKVLKTELDPLLKPDSGVFSEEQRAEMTGILASLIDTARNYNVNI